MGVGVPEASELGEEERYFATGSASRVADITTSFKNGDAISAKTTAGDISITSTGDLDVDGFYGHGIRALSDTGKITITHTGDIETYGTGGFGIRAITKNDIDITVDGNITTRNSDALLAQASAGNVTISFTGDISTKDNESDGLDIVAKVGTVAITHYDLWHAATANRSPRTRYMLKFLFSRATEPAAPSWRHDPEKAAALMGRLTFETAVTCSQSDHYKERRLRREMWDQMTGAVR